MGSAAQMNAFIALLQSLNQEYLRIIDQNRRDTEFKSYSQHKEICRQKQEQADTEWQIGQFPVLLKQALYLASKKKHKLKESLQEQPESTRRQVGETLGAFGLEV